MPDSLPAALAVVALDVGGSHVSAATVDPDDGWQVLRTTHRALAPDGTAEELLHAFASVAAESRPTDREAIFSVAIPGPFDYERGSGSFSGVSKFASLTGLDLRRALAVALDVPPEQIRFVNDAVAYGIGEWVAGTAALYHRVVCVTLGTGVGSAFLHRGEPVTSGRTVPPGGEVFRLHHAGQPIEDTVSARQIVGAYSRAGGDASGVLQVADQARNGDHVARSVLDHAFTALGTELAVWLDRFDADVLVVGGAIAQSWDLVEPPLLAGLGQRNSAEAKEDADAGAPVLPTRPVLPARLRSIAPLVGAAWWVTDRPGYRAHTL